MPPVSAEPQRWRPETRSLRGTAQVGSGVVVGRGDRRREPLHGRSRSELDQNQQQRVFGEVLSGFFLPQPPCEVLPHLCLLYLRSHDVYGQNQGHYVAVDKLVAALL